MFYIPAIFKDQGSIYMVLTFICVTVQVLATFSSIFVTDRLGRRLLLMAGSIGCALGLLFATIFYPKVSDNPEIAPGTYIFDIAIYFFVASFGVSYGPVW